MPPSPARGVPSSMAVVPPEYWRVMLAGSVDGVQPVNGASVRELASGVPVVVMSNTPATPAENVAWLPLVMAGAVGVRPTVYVYWSSVETELVPAGVVTVMFTVPGLTEGG